MIGAAKRKSSLLPGLAALRLVLLLIVTLCLGQTRVWGFAITPQLTSGVFESVTPSCIGENTTAIGYDASNSLLAARGTTYTQMEFAFARGASFQTPGVTTAGETFVRVGAAPQNLKFGSTSLSGAQPGTYAFPQATFDAIGPNPAALNNLGDLPGSAPQYFGTLSPPPGTPIQSGIVLGGQYGGVGGVEEVIFPSGF